MLTSGTDKKLFLIDAFALIYRAYYAFIKTPRINSKGENTSAAFGFTLALLDVIEKEKPTHIAVVFDPPGGATNRIEMDEYYKANREEMPEDIRNMIEPIRRIIEAFNIPILMEMGWEADDVIGTIAKIAEKEGFTTYMMTPDKDYAQLVTDNTFMFRPGRGKKPAEIWGIEKVKEKFEVESTDQVIDILGMWGDTADNIPGIPGVGEKTAKKFIKEFGSMEGLYENLDKVNGKLKEKIESNKEQAFLSKALAKIVTDLNVTFEPEKLEIVPPDNQKLREILTELEFRSIAKKMLGEEMVVTSSGSDKNGQLSLFGTSHQENNGTQEFITHDELNNIKTANATYHFIDNKEERQKLIQLILKQESVCFDTETDDLEARNADLVGISFSFKAKEAYYVPFPEDFNETQSLIEEFKAYFESETIEKVAHNIKYDEQVINRYGIKLRGPRFDTMVAHYLLSPDGKHNMDFLAEYYLQYQTVPIESLIGKKGKNQKTMRELPQKDIYQYACEDADITWQFKELFEPEIQKDHLKDLFYKIEMPLTEVLKAMEQEGIRLDIQRLKEFSKELEIDLDTLSKQIIKLAGEDFNIDSPKQLGDILFEKLEISKKAKKTKTGQYSTSEETLMKHINDHEIIPLILDYRSLKKLKSTYVDPLPELVDKKDGRLHTHYMQTVASTGRLSSTNPNLQNIPIRTPKGREIRKAFIAKSKDHTLLAADYSQIELRIMAAFSKDQHMIEAFQNKIDIHASTASKVYNVPLDEVTRNQRSNAKAVNFGIIYGQSAFGLAQNLGISRTEAKSIIDNYFAQYPTIKKYMTKAKEEAKEKGYVETIMKRRRYLPDINSKNAIVRGYAERNAINAPIQGSAADIIKIAMINIYRKMKEQNLTSRMLLQVHDELVFDVLKSEKEIMEKLVKEEMENAIKIAVPLVVDMTFADNWLDAH